MAGSPPQVQPWEERLYELHRVVGVVGFMFCVLTLGLSITGGLSREVARPMLIIGLGIMFVAHLLARPLTQKKKKGIQALEDQARQREVRRQQEQAPRGFYYDPESDAFIRCIHFDGRFNHSAFPRTCRCGLVTQGPAPLPPPPRR